MLASRRSMVGLLALAACGSPTTPEGFPELTGEYAATLNAEFTSVPGAARAVQKDGSVTVDVAGGAASFQGFDQCGYVSGEERWRGEIDGDDLRLRLDVVLDCATTGSQRTVATLAGRRAPGR